MRYTFVPWLGTRMRSEGMSKPPQGAEACAVGRDERHEVPARFWFRGRRGAGRRARGRHDRPLGALLLDERALVHERVVDADAVDDEEQAAGGDLRDLQRPDLVRLIAAVPRRDAVGDRLVGEERERRAAERRLGQEEEVALAALAVTELAVAERH